MGTGRSTSSSRPSLRGLSSPRSAILVFGLRVVRRSPSRYTRDRAPCSTRRWLGRRTRSCRRCVDASEPFRREELRSCRDVGSAREALRSHRSNRSGSRNAIDLESCAVRVEPRTLVSLQAFLKPGGHLFLFRGPGGADVAESLTPALNWLATYPLVDALRSRLVVLQKTAIGRRF